MRTKTSVIFYNIDTGEDKLQSQPNDDRYVLHVISVVSEWLTALCYVIFLLTFVEEFRKFEFDVTKLGSAHNKNEAKDERRLSAWDQI